MSQLYKPDLKVKTEDDFNSNGKLFHKVITLGMCECMWSAVDG